MVGQILKCNISKFEQENLKWRVFEIDRTQGKIVLISETPTSTALITQSTMGYKNAVKLMDDYCKVLYSDRTKGLVARNMKIGDIERNLDLDHWNYKDYANAVGNKWGDIESSETNLRYPSLIKEDRLTTDLKHKIDNKEYSGNLGVSEQRRYYDASEYGIEFPNKKLEIVQTYWSRNKDLLEFKEDSQTMKEMIFQDPYFLSSRYINTNRGYANFGIRYVTTEIPNGSYRVSSENTRIFSTTYRLRPVVEILSPSMLKQIDGNWSI